VLTALLNDTFNVVLPLRVTERVAVSYPLLLNEAVNVPA
jgi:hypothetical protein